ncbi:hypothetical protein T484DRAFT_1808992, partial [Baffinella frigidus]
MRFTSVLLLLVGAVAACAGPSSPPSGWIRGGVSQLGWGRLAAGGLRGGGLADHGHGADGKDGLLSVLDLAGRKLDEAGCPANDQLLGEKNLLLRAIWAGESSVVEKVLGCDEGRALVHNIVPDGGSLAGHTALHLAAIKGFSSAAKLLVEHGGAALTEATHPMAGYNALHIAALVGSADIVRLLGEKGGKEMLTSKQVKSAMADEEWDGAKDGDTALHLAAGAGSYQASYPELEHASDAGGCILLDLAPELATMEDQEGNTASQ